MSRFREVVRPRLLELLREAEIPEEEFDTTTLAELALRVERRRHATHAQCQSCMVRYTAAEFTYLESTGYWSSTGHGNVGRTPAGARPELEGRRCRCGQEIHVPVTHVKSSVPWHQNGQ